MFNTLSLVWVVVFALTAPMKGVPRALKRDECGPCVMLGEVPLYPVHT